MYLSPINLEAGPKKGLPKHKPFSNAKLFRTMIGFIKPYRGKFILGSILTLTGETSWLYQAYVLSAIVTFFASYKTGDPFDAFWEMTAIWVVLSLYRYIAVYYSKKIGFGIGEKIAIDAHLKTIRHLFRLDISWHEHENAGNKIKRISHGTEGLDKITRLWFVNVLNIVVGLGGTLFIISRVDGKISLAIGAFLVVYYVIARFCSQRASEASRIVNLKEENIYGLLFESVNNIRSVKVMSMIEPLYRVLVESSNDLFESIKKRVKWFQLSATVKNIWGQLFRIALTAYIAYGISQGQYEIGFLVLTYGYFGSIWQSISELSDLTQEFIISKFRVSRMTEMLDEPVAIDEERGKVAFPKDWKKISIRNLSFSYGKKTVLNSISFDINRGERIGIIGLSGAGKSTILKMLLKEHEGYTGEILIDDVPLRDISKTDYFDHVAVVLQETEVFNFSLKDNITISNDKEAANTALLQKSADIAHVTEFVKGLSSGLDTQIGEKGIRLSGGEKQRVGIARAVFKNPQLLLLDEATSHLDIESEEKIRDSLHQFFQTVTAVVIAHRLTTIKEMNRILVIEDGKILESGNFEELYAKQGRFFELWEKQKL